MSDSAGVHTAITEPTGTAIEPERHGGALVSRRFEQECLHPSRADYLKVVAALKAEGYNQASDLCAVDYLTYEAGRDLPPSIEPERFEVVVNLLSHSLNQRIRIRVQVAADDPTLASLYDLYPGVEAMEREAYDLMGMIFTGHPDLTRILMPDGWEGHPLRKDYATGRIPVQFKGAPQPR